MKFDVERLKKLAKQPSEKEREEALYREENRDWLLVSSLIALELHRQMRSKGIKQNQLAEMLGVSPAQVTKIMSGKENMGLKTICKLEKALNISLLNIPTSSQNVFSSEIDMVEPEIPQTFITPSNQVKQCKIISITRSVPYNRVAAI